MPNAEAMAKANEKRITVIEKKMDALEKATRAAGNFATLEKRVSTLESLVKALAASTKAAGGADRVAGDVATMKKLLMENEKKVAELHKSHDPAAQKRIETLTKQGDMISTGIKTLNGRQEKHRADMQKQFDDEVKRRREEAKKMNDEITKQAEEIRKAVLLDAKLQRLEAMVQAALAK